jgi:hypothetical protein
MLRTRIATHEARLQELAPDARTEAVVGALYEDATTNPTLAAVLERLADPCVDRHRARTAQNSDAAP